VFERILLRIGAVSLVAGLGVAVVFEALHPAGEDPNNNRWSSPNMPQTATGPRCISASWPVRCCSSAGWWPCAAAWSWPGRVASWFRMAAASVVTAAAAYGVLRSTSPVRQGGRHA
jgi:hypothetical protein